MAGRTATLLGASLVVPNPSKEWRMNEVARFATLAWLTLFLGFGACSDNGSAEKAGQKIDKVAELAKQKVAKSDAAIGDAALAERVKAELRKDAALKTADLSIDSRDGAVVLSGTVENPEDIIRAVQIARTVDDVKSVENRLTVRPKG
jgi:hyperosmotically inducible periplasmic protein